MPPGLDGRRDPGHRPLRVGLPTFVLAVVVALSGSRAWAQEEEDSTPAPRLADRVTVTAARGAARVGDTPASVAVLARDALDATAAPTVDDALRQVVGFSLFRRSGSRAANPTAQGVSLRGLGASGASRALVLADGLPINDPFGGWVHWARVPRLALERVEVVRGGASDLYGSAALGGVVQVVTRPASAGRGLEAEASAGDASTLDASATARGGRGPWSLRVSGQGFRTDGYVPVHADGRGAVDTEASSRHAALDAIVERRVSGAGRVFVRGMVFAEDRENGTPLQVNDSQIGSGAVGLDWGGPERGRGVVRAWGQSQVFHQAFSAVTADRSREDRTRTQRVPATALGVSAQWDRLLGSRHRLLAGVEGRDVDGATQETAFASGQPTAAVEAGGTERSGALFVQDLFQVHPRVLVAASARFDAWSHREGHSTTTPLAAGGATTIRFPERSETAWSPRLALLVRAGRTVSLSAAGYGAFRAPTLNELYRSFRVGDAVTLANPALGAERLGGGEIGGLVSRGPLSLRVTAFDAVVRGAVANVTVSTTPGLVTRQRRNVARVRSRGVEAETEVRVGGRAALAAGYALLDSRVASFPEDPALEGRRVPQVPRHQVTLQARYDFRWRLGLQARWTSASWEDDRNELSLGSALQVDLLAARRVARGLEAFVAAENVLDAGIEVARTPVRILGPPRLVRAGLRLRLF